MKYFFLVICMITTNYAAAADVDGKFAVKGAGRKSCSDFLLSKEKGSTDYLLYGGWLEGFISSYNQFQPKNYDITPWQTTELLLLLLAEHCKSNPQTRVLSATNGLIKAFFPVRLATESGLVKVTLKGSESYYYVEIIKRVKVRLKVAGLYSGDVESDDFGVKEIEALVKFQRKAGLRETGIPDQNTLTRLFLKRKG